MEKQDSNLLDLSIDELRLDREWLNQPKLYFNYAEKLADARAEVDRAKMNLDAVRASLDLHVRREPKAFGLHKVTEAAIASIIQIHRDYTEAVERQIEAKHYKDVLEAAVSALDTRRRALEKLVDLHLANYFSAEPKAPKGKEDEVDEMRKRTIRRRALRRKEEAE